jgi:hydroxyethylthiazole kinase
MTRVASEGWRSARGETGIDAGAAYALLERVRLDAPLVHNITNYVVMNTTANALLAVGASPAMVHAVDEVEDFVSISRALVVNIGTLSEPWVDAMRRAVARAGERGVPWVLDPVGAGATAYRTRVAGELAASRPAVIRGNASEIRALGGATGRTKGVDSTDRSDDAVDAAMALATALGTVVAVTGATDYITNGTAVRSVANGDALMARITGMGCTATALVGAFCAVERDALVAATAALAVLGVAGELAAVRSAGPASMQMNILDALYTLDETTLVARARVT